VLAPWQRRLVASLYGWRRPDGRRRYRYLWLEAPCKSGKTTLAASIALYMLFVDPEPAADIVIAAADQQQALICFAIAKGMIERDPDLAASCRILKNAIVYKDARLRIVSSRAEHKHGENISCIIFDELHLQNSRMLHDALVTGMAARSEPLVLSLTTAGWDQTSLAWEQHRYASRVQDGRINDPTWLVSIWAAQADADWTDPEVWRAAHPGLGITITEEFLRQECQRAKAMPGFVNSFRRLYLNIWTEKASAWLDMRKWDACGETTIAAHELIGRKCYAGLDLSSTSDLTALVLVFPDKDGGCTVLSFPFCPDEALSERSRKDRVDYRYWADQGFIDATPGNVVDHSAIRATIHSLAELYHIEEIAFDRWNASMLMTELMADGFSCVPVPQTAGVMNAPVRALERLVMTGTLRHGGHPVLRWCAANTVVEMNASGDLKPTKSKSIERIDLVVALLIALSRHLVRS
jgi:phage terminase large subunit-like protein